MDELGQIQKEAWATLIISASTLLRHIEREVQEEGSLPPEMYDVLLELEDAPFQRMRMTDLAEAVVLSPSGITRLVDRLVSMGYIERHVCDEDRRATYAVLTPLGLLARESAWPAYRTAIQHHFGRLFSEEEARTIRDALRRTIPDRQIHGAAIITDTNSPCEP